MIDGRWQNVFGNVARVTLPQFSEAYYSATVQSDRQAGFKTICRVQETLPKYVVHNCRKGCAQQHGLQIIFQ